MKGFYALEIYVSIGDSSFSFLPLSWEIEILSIEKKIIVQIHFSFSTGKMCQTRKQLCGLHKNQNNLPFDRRIFLSHRCIFHIQQANPQGLSSGFSQNHGKSTFGNYKSPRILSQWESSFLRIFRSHRIRKSLFLHIYALMLIFLNHTH